MDIINLDELKNYLRIDYTEDDKMLQSLMAVANDYLKNAINDYEKKKEKESYQPRLKLLICILVQDWYDNREQVENKTLSYSARSLLTQLQVGDNFE